MPRVSIIVPSYNHAHFLKKCLQAVIDQTFEDWELILIDDGSKDDSVELARSFTDPRLQVHVNDVNLGTYGTEQKALDMSRGSLIAVLNSDDLWASTKLARQVELLDRHPETVLCYTLGWKINQNDVVDESEDVHEDWPTDEIQDILPYLLYENRVLASGVLFRREGLRFETRCRYSGDWVALLEQSRLGPVTCVRERLTFWRMHDNNTFTISPKQLAEEFRVRERISEFGEKWAHSPAQLPLVRRGLGKNGMNRFALAVFFYDRSAALVAAREMVRYDRSRTPVRRALSLAFPLSYLRKYFWERSTGGKFNLPPAELREMLTGQIQLDFPRE